MFYELAKDKSLINVLKKADLDDNTSALVKAGASISILKQSLMDNITSENMISYRKYIRIAKKEEDDEAARRADERLSEEEDADEVYDNVVEEEDARERVLSERRLGEAVDRQNKENDAYKFLSNLEYQVDILIDMIRSSDKIKVVKEGNKLTVRGAMKDYLRLGATAGASSKLLTLLQTIKRNPDYLEEQYGEFLVDGKLTGKAYTISRNAKEEKRRGDDIDVNRLISNLNTIVNFEVAVEESGTMVDSIDFLEMFRLLHVQKYKRQPRNLVPRGKVKSERLRMLERAKRKTDASTNAEYERALRRIDRIKSNKRQIQQSKMFYEDKIEELEKILADKDKIIARKIQKLNQSLKTVMSSGKLNVKKVKELTATFKDIQENKEKYLKEATRELEKEIAQERRKLQRVIADVDVFDQTETISKFSSYLNRFRQMEPIAEVKRLLTKGITLLSYMRKYSNEMSKISVKSEGEVTMGFKQFMQENPEATNIVDGFFEGFPTIPVNQLMDFEEVSDKFQEKENQLSDIVNQLDRLVKGEDSSQEEE